MVESTQATEQKPETEEAKNVEAAEPVLTANQKKKLKKKNKKKAAEEGTEA
jgi:hypothetical protein